MEHDLIEKAASNATMAGGITALFGGLTSSDIAAFGGLLIAVIGLAINAYYKHQSNKRAQELHELKINNQLRTNFFDDEEVL